MKKILSLQVVLLVICAGGLGGMLLYTDIYTNVQDTIVSTLCLSCIKLDPVTHLEFTFETANGENHPDFVLQNLTKGPIFIEYRSDVCEACDEMAPIVKDIFNLHFEKEDIVEKEIDYNGQIITFYHINLDHASEFQKASYDIYDKNHVNGVPMFVIITVMYNRGFIEPVYATAYGTLGLKTDQERMNYLTSMIDDGFKLYEQNHEGYEYP